MDYAAYSSLFLFNDTANTEIYTLSYTTLFRSKRAKNEDEGITVVVLITLATMAFFCVAVFLALSKKHDAEVLPLADRKSTRLNSSHGYISYAVFCLKKKNSRIIPRS